jgi:hypothetical protein
MLACLSEAGSMPMPMPMPMRDSGHGWVVGVDGVI